MPLKAFLLNNIYGKDGTLVLQIKKKIVSLSQNMSDMKKIAILSLCCLMAISVSAADYEVSSPNGKVKVTGLDILPTWVDLTDDGEGRVYSIVALDHEKDPSSWGASSEDAAINSYNRTMGRISDGYNRFRESIHLNPDPESF